MVSTFGVESGPEWEAVNMAHKYPNEFRVRAVALVRGGQTVVSITEDLGIADSRIGSRAEQDRMGRDEREGVSSAESRALRKAIRGMRHLSDEVEFLRRANALFGSSAQHPKGSTR